jgi:hypothetical protein
MLRGNTDRYVLTGEQPAPHATAAAAVGHLDLVERYAAMAAGIGWTRGVLAQAGTLEQLAALPAQLRLQFPGGARLMGVHASPGADHGPGIDPDLPGEQLRDLLTGCDADVVVGGHTHYQVDRRWHPRPQPGQYRDAAAAWPGRLAVPSGPRPR